MATSAAFGSPSSSLYDLSPAMPLYDIYRDFIQRNRRGDGAMATSAVFGSPSSSLYDLSPAMSPLDIDRDFNQRNREPLETCNTITGKPRAFIQQFQLRTPPRESGSRPNGSHRGWRNGITGKGRPHKKSLPTDKGNHSPRLRHDSTFGKENLETLTSPLRGESESPCGTPERVRDSTHTQENLKRKKLSLGRIPKSLLCYTCVKTVREPQFTDHLFFAEVQCIKCLKRLYSCRHFQEDKLNAVSNTCEHKYVFCGNPSEYLSTRLQDDLPSDPSFEIDLHKEMTSYLSALKGLERKDPWKDALHQCHEFLTGEKSQSHDSTCGELCHEDPGVEGDFLLSQPYSLEHLDRAVEYQVAGDVLDECLRVTETERTGVRKATSEKQLNTLPSTSAPRNGDDTGPCNMISNHSSHLIEKEKSKSRLTKSSMKQTHKHSKRLKTTTTSHTSATNTPVSATPIFLQTPEDGYYLVVHHAIEECPMCYTELCPSRLTLNYENFLISGVCSGCNLAIYIIFPPPDGSPPKVSIVLNSSPNTKKRVGEQKPRKKMRIRDFLKR